MIHVWINGKEVEVPKGTTILEAARKLNIKIPTLCHLDLHDMHMVNQLASCRVCMVEQEGRDKMLAACSTPVWEGLRVRTDTIKVIQSRRMMIEMLLSNHPKDCLICRKNGNCELQDLAAQTGVRRIHYPGKMTQSEMDESSLSIVRNMQKCVLCKRCETMCNEVQTVGTLTEVGRGFDTLMGTLFNMPMHDTTCTFCGQCVAVCPTAALTEVNNVSKVWNALSNKKKTVIVQTAPAVRVALGEAFGMEPGTDVTGKMVAALRALGFDKVYDTNFAADITVMEEAAEMVQRIEQGGRLPILTSCCPSWVKFLEHQFGDMLDIPSTAKSPHEIFGSLAKTYLAEKLGVDPKDMVVVSVMPCVAKKYESARPELGQGEMSDVDIVITTRELAQMLHDISLDFVGLEDEDFDELMGESSGAGDIFGSSGGVIEAALRTAYEWLTGKELKQLDFYNLRGLSGIKEAKVEINGKTIRIACANGLGNAREVLRRIRDGEADYTAIEIMACPGGCIAGGGQPYHRGDVSVIHRRMESIYKHDQAKKIRQSHKNPRVLKIYEEFLGEPCGHKAHELLHTSYTWRQKM